MIITDKHKIEFSASLNSVSIVERFAEEICDYFNVNNEYYGNILVALTEAASNAIIHGSKSDTNKKIQISFQAKNGCLSFTVKDQGNGFDFNNIPDPTDPNNENENAGRGIYLIKSLSDEVNFLENGRVVEINFKISNINSSLATKRIQQYHQHLQEKKVGAKKK
ncbi:MAG: ATP-binding protein [Bacteroidales bacterium]|nr:ATP-binding protein [Bacteroidales bacterium]